MNARHCEMIGVICRRLITKTAIFTNTFGQEVRLGLCREHAVEFSDPAVRKRLLQKAMSSWSNLNTARSPQEMLEHPAQRALLAHQDGCQQCADVRDWIVVEAQKGITGPDDVMAIGRYVAAHCCPLGLKLNEEVGRVMQGL